ncbi:MAG: hypothetical protein K6E81_08255 [Lachnospiraceae bacterium]|nr:hypothetical protein [Lachnospiraceae bacterium]
MDNDMEVLQQELKSLRRSLRINRILNAVILVLLIALLAGGYMVVQKVLPSLADVKAIAESLEEMESGLAMLESVDIDGLTQDVDEINAQLSSVDWESIITQVEALDVDGFNEAMDSLEALDAKELEKAIENLNAVMATFQKLPFFKSN